MKHATPYSQFAGYQFLAEFPGVSKQNLKVEKSFFVPELAHYRAG